MRRCLLPLCLSLGLYAGCSDPQGSNDGEPAGSADTGNAAVDEIVNAYCGTVRSCCVAAGHPASQVADCESVFSTLSEFQAVIAGRVSFREPERSQCVAYLESLGQSCDPITDQTPCGRLFEGVLGEGTACDGAEQCLRGDAGVACLRIDPDGNNGSLPGTCRSLSVGALGTACFQTVDSDGYAINYSTYEPNPTLGTCDRRSGLYCDFVSSTCRALVAAGEPCTGYDDCADGLYCNGTCVPKLPQGSSCESFDECANGLACSAGVCTERRLTDGDLCEGDYD